VGVWYAKRSRSGPKESLLICELRMNRRVTELVAAGATAATNSEMRIIKLQLVHLTSLTSLTRNFIRNL
jgi:hypothetical protein